MCNSIDLFHEALSFIDLCVDHNRLISGTPSLRIIEIVHMKLESIVYPNGMSPDAFGNQSLNIELGSNILEAMDMSDEELGESRDSTQVNWKADIVDMKEHLLLVGDKPDEITKCTYSHKRNFPWNGNIVALCCLCKFYVHCVICANHFALCYCAYCFVQCC